jgi:hypothetical protein
MRRDKRSRAPRDKSDPTPAEIRRRCARIRDGWTDRDRAKRAGIVPQIWHPPRISVDEVPDIASTETN